MAPTAEPNSSSKNLVGGADLGDAKVADADGVAVGHQEDVGRLHVSGRACLHSVGGWVHTHGRREIGRVR